MLANDSWPAHVFAEPGLQRTPARVSRSPQDGEADAGKTWPVPATYIFQHSKSPCCSLRPKITVKKCIATSKGFGFRRIARNAKGSSPDICCYLVLTYIMLLIAEPSLFSLLSTRVRIILFLWFMASCHLQHKVHSKENKTTTRLPTNSVWRAGVCFFPLFCFSLCLFFCVCVSFN